MAKKNLLRFQSHSQRQHAWGVTSNSTRDCNASWPPAMAPFLQWTRWASPAASALFVLFFVHRVGAEETGTSYREEVRRSCQAYAVEEKIPAQEIERYVDICVRDLSTPQAVDESLLLGIEEGIGAIPTINDPAFDTLPNPNQTQASPVPDVPDKAP